MIPRLQHEVLCSYCGHKCVKQSGEICCGNQSKLRQIDNILNECIGYDSRGEDNGNVLQVQE